MPLAIVNSKMAQNNQLRLIDYLNHVRAHPAKNLKNKIILTFSYFHQKI